MKNIIVYRGDFSSVSGYARCARSYARMMIEAGMNVKIRNLRKDIVECKLDSFWEEELPKRLVDNQDDADIVIWHETPEFYNPDPSQFNIAYTMIETTKAPSVNIGGAAKRNWVTQLNRMDLVLVPCRFAKTTFENSGITTPIEVVHHVVEDIDTSKKPLYTRDTNGLHLVSVFQWTHRKDPESTILSFYQSDTGRDTRMYLKTYGMDFAKDKAKLLNRVTELRKSFHVQPKNKICLLLDQLSDEDMSRFYLVGDVFLTSTRGEGFGLPMVEAMLSGMPLIAPAGTSFEDYLDEEVGFPIGYTWAPVYDMPWPCYSPDQRWMQVNFDELVQAIEEANRMHKDIIVEGGERISRLKAMGRRARKKALRMFSSKTIEKVYLPILRNCLTSV